MKIKQLFKDDDAVSPVIGVILMVAITVILAAVIASFVLGLGDSQNTAPNASFNFDYDESSSINLTVTKSGGDSIEGINVYIRGANPSPGWGNYSSANSLDDYSTSSSFDYVGGFGGSGEIGAGQGFEVDVNADYEITLVYEDGDISEELVSDEGPEA